MKRHPKLEKWIRAQIKEYCDALNLHMYELYSLEHTDNVDDNVTLQIYCNYPYVTYRVQYTDLTIKMFKEKRLDNLRSAVMHEVIHLALQEFSSKAATKSTQRELDHAEERFVDHMTVALRKFI